MNVTLRPIGYEDLGDVWTYCSDRSATRYLTWTPYDSKEDFEKFFRERMLNCQGVVDAFLAVLLDDRVVGTAHLIQRSQDVIQIGFGFLSDHWNKGIGGRVLGTIESYIRQNIKDPMRRWVIRAECHTDNHAARKIFQNLGAYSFQGSILGNRVRFERILYCEDNFLEFLRDNDRVDSVLLLGSLRPERYSDTDVLVLVSEESDCEQVAKQIIRFQKVVPIDRPSANHLFVEAHDHQLYDVYILSTACFHAIHSVKDVVFDESGFISKLIGREMHYDLPLLVGRFTSLTERFLNKVASKKYVQATRVLTDIRNRSIVPLGCQMGVIEATSIIDVHWKNSDGDLYRAYMSTFVPPLDAELKNALSVLFAALELITELYSLDKYAKRLAEMTEYAKSI